MMTYFCNNKFNQSISVKITMAKYCIFFLFILYSSGIAAQPQKMIAPADLKKLRAKEDTLKDFARYLITDSLPEDRMISDSIFTRTLVRALRVKNSFYYPFDSIVGVSR